MYAARVMVVAALLGVAACETDGLPRLSSTGSTLPELGGKSTSLMVDGAAALPKISGPVSGVAFSKYSDKKWDSAYIGSSMFYMGLGYGGCGWGNLLNADKYPHLMAIALSRPTREALGIPSQTVGCGVCVRIKCEAGGYYCQPGQKSIVGVVTDVCPETGGHSSGKKCLSKHVDMYTKAWDIIGKDSNPDVVIERVQCPALTSNVKLYVMENNGPSVWLKLNFQDVAGSGLLTKVEMECEGAEAVSMKNQYGAVWVLNNQPKKVNKCRFHLTTDDDKTLVTAWTTQAFATGKMDEAKGVDWVDVWDTGVQFRSTPAMGSGVGGGATVAAATVVPKAVSKAVSDVAPDSHSCAEQKAWGKCNESFMFASRTATCPPEGCCAATCGRAATGRRLLRA